MAPSQTRTRCLRTSSSEGRGRPACVLGKAGILMRGKPEVVAPQETGDFVEGAQHVFGLFGCEGAEAAGGGDEGTGGDGLPGARGGRGRPRRRRVAPPPRRRG